MAVSCKMLAMAALGYVVMALDEEFCSNEDPTCTSAQFLQVNREVLNRQQEMAPLTGLSQGKDMPPLPDEFTAGHPWPTMRGKAPTQFGTTSEVILNHTLRWNFSDPEGQFHNIFAGGAAIDKDLNLYQMTAKGLYAFNSSGHQLWHYETPGLSNNEVSLHEDLVLGSCHSTGKAFAVNRSTGKAVWVEKLADDMGGDCGYPAAYAGVFVVGAVKGNSTISGGNAKVFGLDVKDGKKLWEYTPDQPVWNLAPLFPDADSCVFMDFAGGMYKLNLKTGEEIWTNLPPRARGSFSDGGATLGPNGMVYSCSNPWDFTGMESQTGMVRAFDLSDGTIVWQKAMPYPCNSYPAVGSTAGVSGLSVVVVPGAFMGLPHLRAEMVNLDAMTGDIQWSVEVEPYTGNLLQAAGDAEGMETRKQEGIQAICLPAHWSAPIIDGNGAVMVGRADGNVYSVFGPNASWTGARPEAMNVTADGILWNIATLGSAFLHGAIAAAPGMFSISTCDTLYVYQK